MPTYFSTLLTKHNNTNLSRRINSPATITTIPNINTSNINPNLLTITSKIKYRPGNMLH